MLDPNLSNMYPRRLCLPTVDTINSLQVEQDEDGFALKALEGGRLMARHYIRYKTMALMCRAPPQMQMIDIILLLAQVCHPEQITDSLFAPTGTK